jgi:hypothetical protein
METFHTCSSKEVKFNLQYSLYKYTLQYVKSIRYVRRRAELMEKTLKILSEKSVKIQKETSDMREDHKFLVLILKLLNDTEK